MHNIYISDKKKNKGFTLVELIVVIVILAILIGVTIGGIYMYVGQSRINTDVHNAKVIEDTASAMIIPNINTLIKYKDTTNSSETVPVMILSFGWFNDISSPIEMEDVSISTSGNIKDCESVRNIVSVLNSTFTDGLPAPKSKGGMFLMRLKGYISKNGEYVFGLSCRFCKSQEDSDNINYIPVLDKSKLSGIISRVDEIGRVDEVTWFSRYKFDSTFKKDKLSLTGVLSECDLL